MKPHRIRMAHNLVLNYGLYKKMEVYVSITTWGSNTQAHPIMAAAVCRVGRWREARRAEKTMVLSMLTQRNHSRNFSCPFQRPHRATFEDMTKFHSDEYVSFLRDVSPDATDATQPDMTRCACLPLSSTEVMILPLCHQQHQQQQQQ